jgi:predicted nucleotidyltransferase
MQIQYQRQLIDILKKYPELRKAQVFLFGSALGKKHFRDVDIGVQGKVLAETMAKVREELEESLLPFKVDLVNFEEVDEDFKNYVFSQRVLWLKL